MAIEQGQQLTTRPSRAWRPSRLVVALGAGALAAAVGVGVLVAQTRGGPPDESSMTDAERMALHQEHRTAAQQAHADYVERFKKSGRDARDLSRAELMYSYDTAPAETLPEAVNRAQTVVLGQVTRVEYAASQGFTQTLVTVRVDETWRGAPVRDAVFWLAGGPSLVGDHEVLGHEPVAPPLFKDDRVALLLNPAGDDRWSVVPWDGVYFVSGGSIVPGLPETPVGRTVAGQPLSDFAAAVKAVP